MKSEYQTRPVTIIDIGDIKTEVFHPESVLIRSKRSNSSDMYMFLDIGSFCYSRRADMAKHEHGIPVDRDSLVNSRIKGAEKIASHIRQLRHGNASSFYSHCKHFIDWIDDQPEQAIFNDIESMKTAYRGYTQHLLVKINLSGISGKPLKQSSAAVYQGVARRVVSILTGLSEAEIRGVATSILKKSNTNHIPKTAPYSDSQEKTFAALIFLINEAHRILVKGGPFPAHISSPDDETFYFYTNLQDSSRLRGDAIISLLKNYPTFPEWSHLVDSQQIMPSIELKALYNASRRRLTANNVNLRSNIRVLLSTYAMTAGMQAFIAATGCNLSVAQNLETDTLKIVPSTQGKRLSGTKSRAKGKTVYPEFGAQFTSTFKKILEIRNWVLNGSSSRLIFLTARRGTKKGFKRVESAAITTLKRFLSKSLPKTEWINATAWRKNVSYRYIKLSGDTILTSEKLGNTEEVARSSYMRPAPEDFAAEMTNFFNNVHRAAIDRTRSTSHIPVKLVTYRHPEYEIPTGQCENPSGDPRRARGFTEAAPAPSCKDPENCLFCEFYAVHADETDIRRLLSLRHLIKMLQGKQEQEHWISKFGPLISRIDEVLVAMEEADSSARANIDHIREDVELGNLDPFWETHLDTLIYMGAVS